MSKVTKLLVRNLKPIFFIGLFLVVALLSFLTVGVNEDGEIFAQDLDPDGFLQQPLGQIIDGCMIQGCQEPAVYCPSEMTYQCWGVSTSYPYEECFVTMSCDDPVAPTHSACLGNSCVAVEGEGDNECQTDFDCEGTPPPPPPPSRCNLSTNTCEVGGTGPLCSTDTDCQGDGNAVMCELQGWAWGAVGVDEGGSSDLGPPQNLTCHPYYDSDSDPGYQHQVYLDWDPPLNIPEHGIDFYILLRNPGPGFDVECLDPDGFPVTCDPEVMELTEYFLTYLELEEPSHYQERSWFIDFNNLSASTTYSYWALAVAYLGDPGEPYNVDDFVVSNLSNVASCMIQEPEDGGHHTCFNESCVWVPWEGENSCNSSWDCPPTGDGFGTGFGDGSGPDGDGTDGPSFGTGSDGSGGNGSGTGKGMECTFTIECTGNCDDYEICMVVIGNLGPGDVVTENNFACLEPVFDVECTK